MAKRGRPRHPDILTPREWEVLAFLREGLNNEQIAERLGTTERTARYHVSEILSKLGVATRQEAAAWQPEERQPWWAAFLLRPIRSHWLASSVGGAVAIAGAAALALFIWAIVRTHSGGAPELGPSALAVGEQHACVLLQGGVKCWGENLWGTLGNGKGGLADSSATPVDVVGLTGRVRAISAGAAHTCALFAEGSVQCWGYNFYGQLGNGEGGGGVANAFSPRPVDVVGLTDAVAIAAGSGHTCAITSSGGVKCWGDNTFGELGDGTRTSRPAPVDVAGLSSGVRAVAAGGNFTCALLADGGVTCWGENTQGELGAPSSEQCASSPGAPLFPCSSTPLDVELGGRSAVAISASGQHICARLSDGTLVCWGSNASGDLGVATTATCSGATEPCSSVPLAVAALGQDVRGIGMGTHHTCALVGRGAAECWGDNVSGQVGDGTTTQRHEPTAVVGLTHGVVAIGGGDGHTCALMSSGAVKCWGTDELGQLGDGTNGAQDCSCRTTAVDVIGLRGGSGVN